MSITKGQWRKVVDVVIGYDNNDNETPPSIMCLAIVELCKCHDRKFSSLDEIKDALKRKHEPEASQPKEIIKAFNDKDGSVFTDYHKSNGGWDYFFICKDGQYELREDFFDVCNENDYIRTLIEKK